VIHEEQGNEVVLAESVAEDKMAFINEGPKYIITNDEKNAQLF
jgi:hypothetical protein